jgi:hypothetical protein
MAREAVLAALAQPGTILRFARHKSGPPAGLAAACRYWQRIAFRSGSPFNFARGWITVWAFIRRPHNRQRMRRCACAQPQQVNPWVSQF